MDPLTHAFLGGTVAHAGFKDRLGSRAVWLGALAAMLPDIDILAILPMGTWGEFVYHRGLTHSLGFGPIVGLLLGYTTWRWHQRRGEAAAHTLKIWIGLFVLTLLSHPLLDAFTSYGTQLLAPFSNDRFAWDAVPILDPFYSFLLLIPLMIGARKQIASKIKIGVAISALLLSTAYLFYGLSLNLRAEKEAARQLSMEETPASQIQSYPTLLQVFLRRIVVRRPEEILVGHLSLWKSHSMDWQTYIPPQHSLIDKLCRTREGEIFTWFSMGQIVPHLLKKGDGFVVELDDIRYGLPETPDRGLWGIRAEFDSQGDLAGPIVRFNHPRPKDPLKLLHQLFLTTFRG
ncbi:MAG: metal-dependent hydrolase [Deltaproteobacteria bacterium]|nr:metal-dependent hydrolase [Deltaproteobacteria bacterium]